MKYALAGLLLMIGGGSCAEVLPTKGLADPRLRSAVYSTDEVYRLYGFVGFHLDIEFEADESFSSLSGGDLDALTYSAHDNVLTLKPKVQSTDMNLSVTTNKRRYYFEYTAAREPPSRFSSEVMFAVRFTYPKPAWGPGDGLTPEERIAQDLARAALLKPRNIDYWFCGDSSVKPLSASDDGVHTRLTFAPKGELPALFVRNDDGSESLLNFNIDDGDVVIHRVAPRFIVRRGKLTGCIVNKGFAGAGDRLKSGTLAPEVKRHSKEERP